VYCPRKSTGALELVKALGAKRLRNFDGRTFWDKKNKSRVKINQDDVIICWGASVPEFEGVRVLNALSNPIDKLKEIEKLSENGVSTVGISMKNDSNPDYGIKFLPRSKYHTGGADLLGIEAKRVDYWVLKQEFVKEYRVHSFGQKSIRAGVKVPRDGFTPVPDGQNWVPNKNLVHPWIRSFDGGWRIKYDGFQTKDLSNGRSLRNLAHQAVKVLGLTFGAVDIGQTSDGTLVVLEVNTAPGVEGGTLEAYKKAIKKWINPEAEGKEAAKMKPTMGAF
jgi:hypothetical protein